MDNVEVARQTAAYNAAIEETMLADYSSNYPQPRNTEISGSAREALGQLLVLVCGMFDPISSVQPISAITGMVSGMLARKGEINNYTSTLRFIRRQLYLANAAFYHNGGSKNIPMAGAHVGAALDALFQVVDSADLADVQQRWINLAAMVEQQRGQSSEQPPKVEV